MEMPRHRIAIAAASFVVGMLLLLFVGGAMRHYLGMVGLILTELMILAVALVSAQVARMDFRQVFRIRRSGGMEWLGSFLIYLSAFFGSAAMSYLLALVVPDMMQETGEFLGDFILSGGFAVALLGVALLPAVCEEAWHRGYLLSSLGSISSVAARVAIMGVVFGLFHFDPMRFPQTMILGLALSFMRIKTDNLLVPMVFHCLNNLISISLLFLLTAMTEALSEQGMEEMLEASAASASAPPTAALAILVLGALSFSILFLALGRLVFKRADTRRALIAAWPAPIGPAVRLAQGSPEPPSPPRPL
jgi:membrane protease YdiL (CAAX protease family)